MIRGMFLASAWALLAAAQDSTSSEELPAIRAVQGDLSIWKPIQDKLEPVTDLVRVAPGDRIGTRKDKHAVLATLEGTLISLFDVDVGHERGMALEKTRDRLVIKLFKGKILVQTFQTGLRVEAPGGVLEGGRSCSVIQVDGRKTKVTVESGTLKFVNSLGTVTLEGGQESTADPSTKPSDPKPADIEKAMGDVASRLGALNLIKNPGFEEGLKEWNLETINGKELATLEKGSGHSGHNSVRLEINDRILGTVRGGWLGFKQNVALLPGKRYLFRAYVRQEYRSGTVKPYLSIEGQGGSRWAIDPSEKGWASVGGVYTAKSDTSGYRISIEALIESERFDAVIWADDFLLLELK